MVLEIEILGGERRDLETRELSATSSKPTDKKNVQRTGGLTHLALRAADVLFGTPKLQDYL